MFDFFEFVANFVKEILMKNTLVLIFILVLQFSVLQTNSQVSIQWYAQYSSPGNYMDKSYAVTADSEGSIYVTGESYAYYGADLRSSEYDIVTVKYSASGQELWARSYHYYNYDGAISIACDPQNNVYVGGISQDSTYAYNFVILKYDKFGNILWINRYDNPAYNYDTQLDGMKLDNNFNIYAFGFSVDYNPLNSSAELVKYDPSGSLLWSRSYRRGNTDFNRATCMTIDNAGNLIVGCYTQDSIGTDYLILKYSQNGELIWSSRKDVNNLPNFAKDIVIDQYNNIYLCGYSYNSSYFPSVFDLLKFSGDGVFIWNRSMIGPYVYYNTFPPRKFLNVDNSGDIIVVFRSDDSSSDIHTKLVKFSGAGNIIWSRSDFSYANPTDIMLDGTGNIYFSAYKGDLNEHNTYSIQKYSASGDLVWLNRNTGLFNFNFVPYGICLDNDSNVIATGETDDWHPSNYLTIKLNQPIGIQPITTEIPNHFSLSQNYPNPFNPSTKIKFAIPKSSFTKLTIYDVLGRQVRSLVNEELKPGIYEAEFNASDIPSGVYFYRITAVEFSETRKMILIK
jgi:hypothetical protein